MYKINKLVPVCLLISLILVVITSCSGTSQNLAHGTLVTDQKESSILSFDQAIEASNCAVSAVFNGEHVNNNYNELEFSVNEILYGYVPEKTIMVFQTTEQNHDDTINYSGSDGHIYKKGEVYNLVLDRSDSLFYDHPRYSFISNIFIPVSDKSDAVSMNGKPIKVKDDSLSQDTVANYLKSTGKSKSNSAQVRKSIDIPFTTATDLSDIIPSSDYIMEVTVKNLIVEGVVHNGNTYACDIISVLNGGTPTTNDSNEILVTFLKGSVKLGGSYIVMLNQLGDDSVIYVQSSKNSVISSDKKDAVEKLLNKTSR